MNFYKLEESFNTPVKKQLESPVFTEDQASVEFQLQQETCEAFIHQDLTFLQPSKIYTTSTESQEAPLASNVANNQQLVTATLIQSVEPVLGITPTEEYQIQEWEGQDIEDILGTTACKGYVKTPIQTLNGINVTQPWHFLPLAEEVKKLAEALRKEKEIEQWVEIPHKNLLNQSFLEQLESLQILEQLAPLQLAREHLPSDLTDPIMDSTS